MNISKDKVEYGKKTIDFNILYARRKTLEIAIHPDCSVVVKAPLGSPRQAIQRKVHKRSRWIIKQLNYFQQFQPRTTRRRYLGGESHLYLGKLYRLKIKRGSNDRVRLKRGYFQIETSRSTSPETVKALLETWYLDKAKAKFAECLDKRWSYFKHQSQLKPALKIRRMKIRWGSLSKNRMLTLNPILIMTPKECIDYVITHELCHLEFRNHSEEFYRLLEKRMPDWEQRKHKLELALM